VAACLNPADIESWRYVDCPVVYDIEVEENHNYFIHAGGPILAHNSSKTISLCQAAIIRALQEPLIIDVSRKFQPSLKSTVYKDFLDVLQWLGIYDSANHNKTDKIYRFPSSGAEIAFYGCDDEQKVRGRKRHICWLNEANEFTWEDWIQYRIRTEREYWLDYNPSMTDSWIYDKILPREDCHLIESTYLDNPFLAPELVKEIEGLKEEDEEYWQIFGLGKRGQSMAQIYSNWSIGPAGPWSEIIYGMDFGFNNPNALVELRIKESTVYAKQIIYKSRLTNPELIAEMKRSLPDYERDGHPPIYCDAAEPGIIEELFGAGFNVYPAKKDVFPGIKMVKRRKIIIDPASTDLLKEIKQYRWKVDKNGKLLDEPVKAWDHALDGIRYGIYTHEVDGGGVAVGTTKY